MLISEKTNENAYLLGVKQGEEKRGSTPLGGANRENLLNAGGLTKPPVFCFCVVPDGLDKRSGGWTEDTTAARYDHAERIAELRAAVEKAK